MTRLNKYRIWDAYLKILTQKEGLTVGFTDGKLSEVSFNDKENYSRWSAMDQDLERGNRFFAQEFTGLADSTGKDVYEGDFVKWDDASDGKYWRVAQVIWNEKGGWTFRTIPSKCIGSCTQYERDFNMTNFIYSPNPSAHGNVLQIIGNIYETPEFLES